MSSNKNKSTAAANSKSKSVANQYAHSLYRNNIYQKKLDSHLSALQQQSIKKQRVIEFRQFTYDMRMKNRKEEWDRNEFSETRQEQKKFIEVMLAREQADLEQKAKLVKFAKERQRLVDKESDLNYLLDKYFNQSRSQSDEEWKNGTHVTSAQIETSSSQPNISSESSEKSREFLLNDSESSLRVHSLTEKLREEKERAKRQQQILKFERASNPVGLETTKMFAKNIDELKFTFKKKSPDKEPTSSTKQHHKVVIIDPKDNSNTSNQLEAQPETTHLNNELFIKKANQVRIVNRWRIGRRFSLQLDEDVEDDDDDDEENDEEEEEKAASASSSDQEASDEVVTYALQAKRNSKEMVLTEINTTDRRVSFSNKLQPLPATGPAGGGVRPSFATSTPVRTAQSKAYNANTSIHALKKQHEITQANVQKNALTDKRFLDLVTSLKDF